MWGKLLVFAVGAAAGAISKVVYDENRSSSGYTTDSDFMALSKRLDELAKKVQGTEEGREEQEEMTDTVMADECEAEKSAEESEAEPEEPSNAVSVDACEPLPA